MNYQRPTELHEKVNAEAMTVFAEHMSQFKGVCNVLRDIESNLSATLAWLAWLREGGADSQTSDLPSRPMGTSL